MKGLVTAGLVAWGAAAGAAAEPSVVVAPVSAWASSDLGGPFAITRTFDQSGLNLGYTSGVTDFDAYIGADPTHTYFSDGREWFAEPRVAEVRLIFDLGHVRAIDKVALWTEDSGGIARAVLSASVDGVAYRPVLTIHPSDTPINTSYRAEVFAMARPETLRFVRLDLTCGRSEGFDGCSLGEIAFSAVKHRSMVRVRTPERPTG
jgi:hypothetical protein